MSQLKLGDVFLAEFPEDEAVEHLKRMAFLCNGGDPVAITEAKEAGARFIAVAIHLRFDTFKVLSDV